MCGRFTVLSDTPIPSAIAGWVIPISRHSTIWMRSRCAGGNFQCRAVLSRRTSALLHLTICPPNQMVGSESCRARKKYCTNRTHPLSPQKSRFKRVWRWYQVAPQALLVYKARLDGIDFIKKQQWVVTNSVALIYAAIVWVGRNPSHPSPLLLWLLSVAIIVAGLIAMGVLDRFKHD